MQKAHWGLFKSSVANIIVLSLNSDGEKGGGGFSLPTLEAEGAEPPHF